MSKSNPLRVARHHRTSPFLVTRCIPIVASRYLHHLPFYSGRGQRTGAAFQATGDYLAAIGKVLSGHVISASPNPMLSMMADVMKPILQNVMSRFMPGVQGGPVEQDGKGYSPSAGSSYREEETDD